MRYGIMWRDWALSVRFTFYSFAKFFEVHVGPCWLRIGNHPRFEDVVMRAGDVLRREMKGSS